MVRVYLNRWPCQALTSKKSYGTLSTMETTTIQEFYFIDPLVTLTPEELALEIAKFNEAAKNSKPMDLAVLDEQLRQQRQNKETP